MWRSGMAKTEYRDLHHRIVENTHEPEVSIGCWPWKRTRDRFGYGRINIWIPCLGRAAKFMTHIALLVWIEAQPQDMDEFYLAYLIVTRSALQWDHTCVNAACCNPDHLDLVTPRVNAQRRSARARI